MFYLIQLNENTIITNKLASFAEYLKIYDNEINFIKIFDKEESYSMGRKLKLLSQYEKLKDINRKYKDQESAKALCISKYDEKINLYKNQAYIVARRLYIYYGKDEAIKALNETFNDTNLTLSIMEEVIKSI